MGGSGSTTRNITMEEDPDTGMVKVSEDLLRRMLGQEEPQGQLVEGKGKAKQDLQQQKRMETEWQARLNSLDKRWQDRLSKVEEQNQNILEINTEEFKKAAEEVEAKFIKQSHVPICPGLQEEVLKCFAANPKQTLNCSQQVKAFTQCVEKARTSIVTKKSLDSD